MNKYLTLNLLDDISKDLAKYFHYSAEDIFMELEYYKSVDIVLRGLILALEQNISLIDACYQESLPK